MTNNEKGLTFIELIISLVILGILASIALPLSELAVKRAKELELRKNLRELRQAIDKYKENYDEGLYGLKTVGASGYPETLNKLVDKKILRRISIDPITNSTNWDTKSFSDKYDSLISDKLDVYDVQTTSEEAGLDGTKYNTW
ncbi:MAG: type II secretion system protein [Candidatus Firestonebacteria bacterium]